ncbi:MAG: adenine nucleotide alpha hydrolase [Xanthobacteraceae bacterium]|nr:adenine nucleotide alpha hydrolase [Xanthobacteraceae bacterium]MBX3549575.1 adenine nucleotide alpha hydrolase [Xanthobacteraceae bacterium]MCW5677619.1 adenine nucleotide alpha hydrolase [Xanthobacteraceae bacterium]
MKPKALISWSSGKDAAWALHRARQAGEYEIVGALTTITENFDRVSMHGVRRELLDAQLRAANLPLLPVTIPSPCPNEIYEARMGEAIAAARANGVTKIVFGDLYLEDIRAYREEKLRGSGIEPVFPLWKIPTSQLAREMIASGLQARVACLDPKKMPRDLAGKEFDEELLTALPPNVDPCAENGEFHTCVTGGPMFSKNLEVKTGEVVERDGFVFADLMLV